MSNIAISVQGVSKRYQVFDNQRSRFLHALLPQRTQGWQEVWALKDISFDVARGESFAVIGRNGSGKSTLLEIITGTLTPTQGRVSVGGRVAALLELGSGFNPEYTGRENVFLNGLLLGVSREQIEQRFDEIAAFADIGEVLDRPVKTYSSGMMVRLAFAVQVALDPEILIVDEALGVGDYFFQQKCFQRLRHMRDNGLTLLFVSHDMGTVRDLCRRALYLRDGQQVLEGDTQTVVRLYFSEGAPGAAPQAREHQRSAEVADPVFGAGIAWSRPQEEGKLFGVRFLNSRDEDIAAAGLGETIRVRAYFLDCLDLEGLRITLVIKNRYDQIVVAQNSEVLGFPQIVGAGEFSVFDFEMDLNLEAGLYSFRVFLSHGRGAARGTELDTTSWFGPLQVKWDYENETAPFLGMFGVPIRGRLPDVAGDGEMVAPVGRDPA